jgi:hypothetical protein
MLNALRLSQPPADRYAIPQGDDQLMMAFIALFACFCIAERVRIQPLK